MHTEGYLTKVSPSAGGKYIWMGRLGGNVSTNVVPVPNSMKNPNVQSTINMLCFILPNQKDGMMSGAKIAPTGALALSHQLTADTSSRSR
jgi:hypothetical protein